MTSRRDCWAMTAAERIAAWKAGSRPITWSAAVDTITASGSRSSSVSAARPSALVVPRAAGSTISPSGPTSGTSSWISGTWRRSVSTNTCRASGATRS